MINTSLGMGRISGWIMVNVEPSLQIVIINEKIKKYSYAIVLFIIWIEIGYPAKQLDNEYRDAGLSSRKSKGIRPIPNNVQ